MNIGEGHLGGYIVEGDPNTWTPELWKWAVERLKIGSMLDVGCGEGHSTKYFRDLGCDVLGIDGSYTAISNSVAPKSVILHDFCNGPYKSDKRYDIIWCCEFVEHVEEKYTKNFLETFRFANKYIFLTYAKPGQKGWHHVNCKPGKYWIKKLEKIGFELDTRLTKAARHLAGGTFFGETGLIFINKGHFNDYNPSGDIRLLCSVPIVKTKYFLKKGVKKLGILLNKASPKIYHILKKLK